MKVAVFHNFIDNIGGAEIVSLTLARALGADIYTTNIDKEKISKMGFPDVLPRIFSIGRIPVNAPWRQQIAFWRFGRLDLRGKYDFFIIAGDWAMSAAVKNRPNLWYVHSPMREIWDLYEQVRKNTVSFFQRPFFDLWVFMNRRLTLGCMRGIEKIACNSENTRKRVKKYLKRDSAVIHPPVETSKLYCARPKGYWLSVNRFVKHKRIELQLGAFSRMPGEKLVLVGSYEQSDHFLEYAKHCQKIKPANVEVKSWVTDAELIELYANCKGFITTSYDEDFGMSVVEAMAAGKPVIAPREGGYKETILSGRTGLLIEDINEDNLRRAVLELGKELDAEPGKYEASCRAQAEFFDAKIFIEWIKHEIAWSSQAVTTGSVSSCP